MDIFTYQKNLKGHELEPLASFMRPRNIGDFIGQKHLVGEKAILRILIVSPPATAWPRKRKKKRNPPRNSAKRQAVGVIAKGPVEVLSVIPFSLCLYRSGVEEAAHGFVQIVGVADDGESAFHDAESAVYIVAQFAQTAFVAVDGGAI